MQHLLISITYILWGKNILMMLFTYQTSSNHTSTNSLYMHTLISSKHVHETKNKNRNYLPIKLLLNCGCQALIEALNIFKADLEGVTLRLHQFLCSLKVLNLPTVILPPANNQQKMDSQCQGEAT